MADRNLEQTGSENPLEENRDEVGMVHFSEKTESAVPTIPHIAVMPPTVTPRSLERSGTAEHLAARRPVAPLDADEPEIKQRLSELRSELTTLLTDFRWGGTSVQDTAERIIPLLNVGSFLQWKSILIPFLLEIDRAGNLIPVWLKIIEQEEEPSASSEATSADTPIGRAKRTAVLMLGNYKYANTDARAGQATNVASFLGKLALDPDLSLYATQSLVQQGTTAAIQALVSALKDAEGWAKVDVVESCLALNMSRFYEVLLASGLDRVPGLESYVAIPIYRVVPLEKYLRQENTIAPRLFQQAALIFAQVIQDSTTPPTQNVETLPILFERPLLAYTHALFEGARRNPTWQHALALHRLAILLGRYWSEISRGAIQNATIVESVYVCLPLMPDIERWMDGPGRDSLLKAVNEADNDAFTLVVKALGELRDPRVTSSLLQRIEKTRELVNRDQALSVAVMCDTLGRLGDRRAVLPLQDLVFRVVSLSRRASQTRRRDNLPVGDPDIPASIVYGAAVRACGVLGDRSGLDLVLRAITDLDPYVRIQGIEALKRIEGTSDDVRSRQTIREALDDPRDSVVRAACQLAVQFHDTEAAPALRHLVETRPELAPTAYDTLRQLGQ